MMWALATRPSQAAIKVGGRRSGTSRWPIKGIIIYANKVGSIIGIIVYTNNVVMGPSNEDRGAI